MKNLRMFFLLIFLVGCNSQDPALFLGKNTCVVPCWYGMTPGKSTAEEVEAILQSLPFVSPSSIEVHSAQGLADISWRFTNEASGYGVVTFDRSGLLQETRIRTIGLSLGDALDALSAPESLWAKYETGQDYVLTLFYPAKGVVLDTLDKPKIDAHQNTDRLTRDLRVYEVEFFSPTGLTTFLQDIEHRPQENIDYILNRLQPWPGFGENVIQIKP